VGDPEFEVVAGVWCKNPSRMLLRIIAQLDR
jgi:hypothetical protein